MSAPRFFFPLSLVLLAALVAAGCTIPGKSRLEGPPKDLPPSLDLVTADVLGFWLYDTSPESKLRAALEGAPEPIPTRVDLGIEQTAPWIGDASGMAIRELDPDGQTDTATLGFADVRSRSKLEQQLEASGWKLDEEAELPGPVRDGVLWTRDASDDEYSAAVVTDDAIATALTTDALKSLLRSADAYAVPERKAMREFAVEAAKRTPVAFVFRADLLRTQVRRPFEHDPALLEFARWATDSNVLVALRDGWVGLAPALDEQERDDHLRVVGAAEWVPDLAPEIKLGSTKPDLLAKLDPDADVAIAVDDVGQHLRELVRAITVGAGQYVTEQDVEVEDDRVELLPLLDQLDGPAAVGYRSGVIEVVFEGDGALRQDVADALDHAGVDAAVSAVGANSSKVTIGARGSSTTGLVHDFTEAGTPPQPPWLWFASTGRGCIGDSVGWLSFDGTDRMTLGADVLVGTSRTCS